MTAKEKRAHKDTGPIRKRRTYSEREQIQAVTALLHCGHGMPILSIEGIHAARTLLGAHVATTTLGKWLVLWSDKVKETDTSLIPLPIDLPQEIITTRQQVIRNLNTTVTKISTRLTDDAVINEAKLRDLAVTMGISVEKIMLLSGINPELTALVQTLQYECEGTRHNPTTLIEDVINAVRSEKLAYKPIDVVSNSE